MSQENRSATAQDLANLGQVVKADLAEVRREMQLSTHEIKRYFDVVIENLHRDLAAGQHDQIEILKGSRTDHERRIRRLERNAGVVAA